MGTERIICFVSEEISQPLEAANWPVLIVDHSGALLYMNSAGSNLFGEILDGEKNSLATIWAEANDVSVLQCIKSFKGAYIKPTSFKFKVVGGGISQFRCYVCRQTHRNGPQFIFQLFPERAVKSLSSAPDTGLLIRENNSKPASVQPKHTVTEPIPVLEPSASVSALGSSGDTALRQKLDCALKLAKTVSLDFNNALTSILGHTSLILSKMPKDHEWRTSLLEVEKSAAKAAEIAYDLGNFSHQEKGEKVYEALNINDVLRNAINLFKGKTSIDIEWITDFEGRIFSAKFDEAKLLQAVTKIMENSIQAIRFNGKILVKSANLRLDGEQMESNLRLKGGDYICVEIQDNGSGIESEVLPRIFEPFYTTKPNPPHRGLGLAWVYGIITNHGGGVTVDSHIGSGTSVKFFLPAEKALVKDDTLLSQDLEGNQTILMVDDEDILLTMGETILTSFGYNVVTANTGNKALDHFQSNPAQIDLLITDMVMPNMSGRELIEQVRKIKPELPILCATGYIRSKTHIDKETYLMKPFTAQDLLKKVKQILNPKIIS